jgi:hypothetical protein
MNRREGGNEKGNRSSRKMRRSTTIRKKRKMWTRNRWRRREMN